MCSSGNAVQRLCIQALTRSLLFGHDQDQVTVAGITHQEFQPSWATRLLTVASTMNGSAYTVSVNRN